jgi:hypothetical protein
MRGNCDRLVDHIRAGEGRLFGIPVPAAWWEELRLKLELRRTDYAALPMGAEGFLVLTPRRVLARCFELGSSWEVLLRGFIDLHGPGGILLSEGWAAGANPERRPRAYV